MIGKPQPWYPGINRTHPIGRDCVMCLPFWEGAGNSIHDVSGTGRHATPDNPIAARFWGGNKYGFYVDTPSTAGSEFTMRPTIGQADGLPTGRNITMMIVVRSDAAITDFFYSERSISAATTDRLEFMRTSGAFEFRYRTTSPGANLTPASTFTPTLGQWYVLVGRKRPSAADLFVDGALNATATGTTGEWTNATFGAKLFTNQPGGSDFDGGMAFLAIIRRSLSNAEIAAWSADPWVFCRPGPVQRLAWMAPQAVAGVTMPRFYHHYQRNTG